MDRLELNGLGNSGGGIFDEVQLAGIHHLYGTVQCHRFESAGIVKCNEGVTAQMMTVEGIAKMTDLVAENLTIEGVLKSSGKLVCDRLKLEGYLSLEGNLKIKEADLCGKLKLRSGVEAERLNLMIAGKSSFTELGANQVRIAKAVEYDSWLNRVRNVFSADQCLVEGHLIEGEDLYLEYCQVQSVYGDRIKIGPYCLIDEVEYKETLEIHPTSRVKHQKRG